MAYIQIPKTCGVIDKDGKIVEQELPVITYVLLAHSENTAGTMLLIEQKQDNNSDFTETYVSTGKSVELNVLKILQVFSDFRRYHFENTKLWEHVRNKEHTSERDKIEENVKSCYNKMCDNPIFKNFENEFFLSTTNFENNFDEIERFFYEDKFSDVGLIELQKIIKNVFAAKFNFDYVPVKEGKNSKDCDVFDIAQRTIYSYCCGNIYDVFFAAVHYCKLVGKKLKLCRFCHNFFFAANKKEKYCNNPFEYKDWEDKVHKYPQCAGKIGAKKKILDKLQARKIKIKKRLSASDYLDDFERDNYRYEEDARSNSCIESYIEYEKFLYIECETYYKKYERRVKLEYK